MCLWELEDPGRSLNIPCGSLDYLLQAKENSFWASQNRNHAFRRNNLKAVQRKDSIWES